MAESMHACLQVPSASYSQGVAEGMKALLATQSNMGNDIMAALNHLALSEGALTSSATGSRISLWLVRKLRPHSCRQCCTL